MVGNFFKISDGQLFKEASRSPEAPARHGYEFEEARFFLMERFQAAAESIDSLPAGACPDGYLVVEIVQHPDRLGGGEFPSHFLSYLGLTIVGSRHLTLSPRRLFERPEADPNRTTVSLYVAGPKAAFVGAADKFRELWPDSKAAAQMACLETVRLLDQASRLLSEGAAGVAVFDVTLFPLPRSDDQEFPFRHFRAFAAEAGFDLKADCLIRRGGLLFLPVHGLRASLPRLAQFVFVRQIEEAARLRPFESPVVSSGPSPR
jgi:hypothetical protein